MAISRETDYAIRMLRRLSDNELHNISEMCDSEQIPKHFGYKIVEKLQAAKMVNSIKGRNGGCRLAVNLHDITMFDVIAATGNKYYLNQCLEPDKDCAWRDAHNGACTVHEKLAGLQEEVNDKLREMDMYSVLFGEDGTGK